jgi:hypothetical protein
VNINIGLWLKDWATPLSALATLAAVIVALGLGVWSIIQTQRLQKKERKERLLNEIIEWVTDIQKVSLEIDIPVTSVSLDKKIIDSHIMRRYGIPYTRNNYIKSIVSRTFKSELSQDIDNMIGALTAFMFCYAKTLGIKNEEIKSAFRGKPIKIIEEVEERLKEKSVQVLWKEYAEEKSIYADIILIKVGNIMASL